MHVDPYHTQLLLLVLRAGWLGVQVVKVSKLGGLLQKIYTAPGSCRSTHSEPYAYTAPLTKQQMVTLHLTPKQRQAITSTAWADADLPHCFKRARSLRSSSSLHLGSRDVAVPSPKCPPPHCHLPQACADHALSFSRHLPAPLFDGSMLFYLFPGWGRPLLGLIAYSANRCSQ